MTLATSERNRLAAAAGNARIAKDRAAARERVLNRLAKTSEAAAIRELELLTAGGFVREDLRAVTDSRVKAIQQFELLEGRATERVDAGQEILLKGVALAFRSIVPLLEQVGHEFADRVTSEFAAGLRNARDELERLELDAASDAEFEPVADEPEP